MGDAEPGWQRGSGQAVEGFVAFRARSAHPACLWLGLLSELVPPSSRTDTGTCAQMSRIPLWAQD